jgi:hypothetical protein
MEESRLASYMVGLLLLSHWGHRTTLPGESGPRKPFLLSALSPIAALILTSVRDDFRPSQGDRVEESRTDKEHL